MDRGLTVHASRMHKKELRNANKEFNCNNCSLKCSAKNDMYKYKKEDHITKRKEKNENQNKCCICSSYS